MSMQELENRELLIMAIIAITFAIIVSIVILDFGFKHKLNERSRVLISSCDNNIDCNNQIDNQIMHNPNLNNCSVSTSDVTQYSCS